MIGLLSEVFIPDGEESQRWASDELSKQEYQEAKPTWFDDAAAGVFDWFSDLFTQKGSGGVAPIAITLILIVVIAALVVALLVWGRPRASHTVARPAQLLGERDDRTAQQLRTDAERRAAELNWDEAVVLRYRALARGLIERDLIAPAPGATAQSIAREASIPFPGFTDRLHAAATAFDSVRYLRTAADEGDYRAMTSVDNDLSTTTPTITASPAVLA